MDIPLSFLALFIWHIFSFSDASNASILSVKLDINQDFVIQFENIPFFDFKGFEASSSYSMPGKCDEFLKIPPDVVNYDLISYFDAESIYNFMVCCKSFKNIAEKLILYPKVPFNVIHTKRSALAMYAAFFLDGRDWSKFTNLRNHTITSLDFLTLNILASLEADHSGNLRFTKFILDKNDLNIVRVKSYFKPEPMPELSPRFLALRYLIRTFFGLGGLIHIYYLKRLEYAGFTPYTFQYLSCNDAYYNLNLAQKLNKFANIDFNTFGEILKIIGNNAKNAFIIGHLNTLLLKNNSLSFYLKFREYCEESLKYFTAVNVPPHFRSAFLVYSIIQNNEISHESFNQSYPYRLNLDKDLKIIEAENILALKFLLQQTEFEYLDDFLKSLKFVLFSDMNSFDFKLFKSSFAANFSEMSKFVLKYLSKISIQQVNVTESLDICSIKIEILEFLGNQEDKTCHVFEFLKLLQVKNNYSIEDLRPIFLKASRHFKVTSRGYEKLVFANFIASYVESSFYVKPLMHSELYLNFDKTEWLIFALEHTPDANLSPVLRATKQAFFPENGLFDIKDVAIHDYFNLGLDIIDRMSRRYVLKDPEIYAKLVVFANSQYNLDEPRAMRSIPFMMRNLKDLSVLEKIFEHLNAANKLMTFTYISSDEESKASKLIHLKSHFETELDQNIFLRPGISGLDLLFFDDSNPLIGACLTNFNVNSRYRLSLNYFHNPSAEFLLRSALKMENMIFKPTEWTLLELAIALRKFRLAALILKHENLKRTTVRHRIDDKYSLVEFIRILKKSVEFDPTQKKAINSIRTQIRLNIWNYL